MVVVSCQTSSDQQENEEDKDDFPLEKKIDENKSYESFSVPHYIFFKTYRLKINNSAGDNGTKYEKNEEKNIEESNEDEEAKIQKDEVILKLSYFEWMFKKMPENFEDVLEISSEEHPQNKKVLEADFVGKKEKEVKNLKRRRRSLGRNFGSDSRSKNEGKFFFMHSSCTISTR